MSRRTVYYSFIAIFLLAACAAPTPTLVPPQPTEEITSAPPVTSPPATDIIPTDTHLPPPTPAPAALHFTDISDEAVFRPYRGFPDQDSELPLNPYPAPGFADWDGDGDLDLPGYRNDCGAWVDVQAGSGIEVPGHYRGGIWGDYDADGDFDLVSLAYVWYLSPDRVWKNLGDGTFVEIGEANGMNHYGFGGETATWADYDGDADLDLFIGNYECGALWRNDGNDTFTEVLASTGIDMSDSTMPDPNNPGACIENPAGPTCIDGAKPESSTLFDYNGDGWLDVFITGRLWKNQGDGTFVNVTEQVGGFYSEPLCQAHEEGFAPADVDNDGDFDISIHFERQDRIVIFEHDSSLTQCGTLYCPRWSLDLPADDAYDGVVGTKWIDADHDGDLDLYLDVYAGAVNQANWLINDGAWGFTEVSDWLYDTAGNLLNYPHLFSTFGDHDMDGDLDLALWKYTSGSDGFPIMQYRLLRNDLNPAGGWLQVRVTDDLGRLTQFGAVVRLRNADNGQVQTRYVDGGTNWTINAYDVHFAVDDTATYELSVTFPRLAGEDLLVVDPSTNPSLRFTPGELPSRVLSISRGGVTYAVLSACDGGPDDYIPLAPASTGIIRACSLNSDTNGIVQIWRQP